MAALNKIKYEQASLAVARKRKLGQTFMIQFASKFDLFCIYMLKIT